MKFTIYSTWRWSHERTQSEPVSIESPDIAPDRLWRAIADHFEALVSIHPADLRLSEITLHIQPEVV